MKKILLIATILITNNFYGQEHFAGLNTSSRIGILTAAMNPAELTNMSSQFEVNIIGASVNVSNNKIGFSDLTSDSNIEDLIFIGDEPVNMRFDVEVLGPGLAMKYKKWAFGITSKANGKLNIIDVDTKLGDAISNSGLNSLISSTNINNKNNQRIIGTTWGEIDLILARTFLDTQVHKFNGGLTFKLLFPGSYANLGADSFNGTISQTAGQGFLTNTNANLNFSYSGSLASSFSNFDDYTQSVFGGLNGFAGDIGFNYQWKDEKGLGTSINGNKSNKNKYKLNAGVSIRNIGSMTFKDNNNNSTNYTLQIQGTESLNLNQFENVDSLQEVENILLNSGYLTKTSSNKDFKVQLPTTLTLYTDVKLLPILYTSVYLQQKMNDDSANDQITAQNIFTLTPRLTLGLFEAYIPFSNSEISGFATGIGFSYGGFYIGSGSAITAMLNDSKQADMYLGFRWGFL
jgi:hypothetical protein